MEQKDYEIAKELKEKLSEIVRLLILEFCLLGVLGIF